MNQPVSSDASVLARELQELRAREAAYRERLSAAAELTRRLRKHTQVLLEVLRKRTPAGRSDMTRMLAEVARESAKALGVERTSVWLFADAGARLVCKLLLVGDREQPSLGASLVTSTSPAYFQAISQSGVVAVEDIEHDPRCAGLEPYLRTHGVRALLDISIAIPGELIGVVCHEHTGGPRVWQPQEIDFATHVGDLVALALEVERRQLAEARLLGSEAKYRYLVESLPVSVYSFDAHSNRLEYLSPQIRELGAFDADDLLARGVSAWLEQIRPEDRRQVEARFLPGGVDLTPPEIQYRLQSTDGEFRYIRDHCRVVRNHAGEAVAIQGVLADVTEQRVAEAHSAELESRLRTLLQHVDLIALVLDTEGRAEFVNDCFERVTGYKAEQVVGVDCFGLLVPDTASATTRERFLRDVRSGSILPRFEHEISTRSGETRRIVWTNTLLRTDNGEIHGTCSLGLDVTARARLEAELRQQTKLESLGQLSAGVAHDFNNLLTVMMLQTEQLSSMTSGENAAPAIELLRTSLQQAAELTRSLLVYARKEPVFLSLVGVEQLIEETTPLLIALTRHEVMLVRTLHAGTAQVLIDATQLRQLLLNLLGNAVDATIGHGKEVSVATDLEFLDDMQARERGASQGGQFVVISVSDDGRGMDKHTLARVFEPFFTTKEPGKGTGLGLAMCQSIVSRAGGFMAVTSEPGRGTNCRAYLPLAQRPKSQPAVSKSTPVGVAAKNAAGHALSALVVEDEPAIRELMVALLLEMSFTVQAVDSAQAAARIAATEAVDLLITDGTLPDGSGRVLARSARAARPEIRILLVSGNPDDSQEFDAAIHKPFTRAALCAAVMGLVPAARVVD